MAKLYPEVMVLSNCAPGIEPGGSEDVLLADNLSNHVSPMQWHAAYVCARHEKHVAQQLQQKGVDHFLPVYRSIRRWKDRHKTLELPLFPCYVFVHIGPECRLRVLQTPGVVRFVGLHGHPASLENSEIESLRRGFARGMQAEPYPHLIVGQKVRVKHGPLAGTEGILLRRKDRLRVVLSINLIMRSVAAEIHAADLE